MRPFFYVKTIQNVHLALADMFNNIYVNKYSDIDRVKALKTVKVPLVIGGYDKNFANFIRNTQRKELMPMPVMGIRFADVQTRYTDGVQPHYIRKIYSKTKNEFVVDAQPVPHTLSFRLDILCESFSDYGQIVENITPYFAKGYQTLRINEFKEYGHEFERKAHVSMNVSSKITDEYERNSQRRELQFSLDIKVKIDFYKPRSTPTNIVTLGMLNYHFQDESYPFSMRTFGIPTELVDNVAKPWDHVSPAYEMPHYSVITTFSGNPIKIPDFTELKLAMNAPTDFEVDQSAFGHDQIFTRLSGTRTLAPSFPTHGGSNVENAGYSPEYESITGYEIFSESQVIVFNGNIRLTNKNLEIGTPVRFESIPGHNLPAGITAGTAYKIMTSDGTGMYSIQPMAGGAQVHLTTVGSGKLVYEKKWDKFLGWFGSNGGLMEAPYSFKMTIRLDSQPSGEVVFQHLYNKASGSPEDPSNYIPENSVWYVWGLDATKRLFFTYSTFGPNAMSYKFTSADPVVMDIGVAYDIEFVLHDDGRSGIHIFGQNGHTSDGLITDKDDLLQ